MPEVPVEFGDATATLRMDVPPVKKLWRETDVVTTGQVRA
jgi:hypothetical protein